MRFPSPKCLQDCCFTLSGYFNFEASFTFCQVGPRAVDLFLFTGRSSTAVYSALSGAASPPRDYSQKDRRTAPAKQAAVLHSEIYTCRPACQCEHRSPASGALPCQYRISSFRRRVGPHTGRNDPFSQRTSCPGRLISIFL